MIERIARAGKSARAALHGHALVLARSTFTELGQVVDVEVYVVGDEEVEASVVVVVEEGSAHRPARVAHARLRGNVRERAVAVVLQKVVRAEAGDVEVIVAVVVEVADDSAHAPAYVSDARLVRHVRESAVAVVAVESASRLAA